MNELAFPTNNNDVASLIASNTYFPQLKPVDYNSPIFKLNKAKAGLFIIPVNGDDNEDAGFITVGIHDTDIDNEQKGMFEGIPISYMPHALLLVNGNDGWKVLAESFTIGDEMWNNIDKAYKSKPRVQGAGIGVDVLYYIAADQLNYDTVLPKYRDEVKKRHTNGVFAVLYYKNSCKKYAQKPTALCPSNTVKTLTKIKVKAKLQTWQDLMWQCPEEHVILEENISPAKMQVDKAMQFKQRSPNMKQLPGGSSGPVSGDIIDKNNVPR